MSKYKAFIFKDYTFDASTRTLSLDYSLDDLINFRETYVFDFDYIDYDEAQLDRAFQTLFFLAGVSYFKTYVPDQIVLLKGNLDEYSANFFSKTYEKGLGEFWYVNNLDPNTRINFPVNSKPLNPSGADNNSGLLVGLGGGKDSLVVVEALRQSNQNVITWSLNHKSQLEPLVKTIGIKHLYVERKIDRQVIDLNTEDALNGHVPISAILAATGMVVAILSGNRDIVVGNERTANEPTLTYQGVEINHQYSKTQEFETDFQRYLKHTVGDSVRYYSFLRPLSELRIAEIFAKTGDFDKYLGVFSSCNRAYTLHSDKMSWCGECPKCAFIFLILSPFVEQVKLESIWNGKNLLLTPTLEPMYRKLLGIEGDKPLDCVGEIKESRAAMKLVQNIYPELTNKYAFDIPDDYDYKSLGSDEMPEDIKPLFSDFMSKF